MPREAITGVVLAGGRGSRMGGADKGLQTLDGEPLAWHALSRLRAQVGPAAINANRHLEAYAAMGVPVWPDALPDHPGPLAGFLAALAHCKTPWLVTVPCDTPNFPLDLVERLASALEADAVDLALAATREHGEVRLQPVFCLLRASLVDSLREFMASGSRSVERWTAQQRRAVVVFDDAWAFFNANTLDELRQLQR